MAEIFRNTATAKVKIELPDTVPGAVVAIRKDGEPIALSSSAASGSGGRFEYTVPYSATLYDGDLEVDWTYSFQGETHTVTQHYDVVTPLVNPERIVASLGEPALSVEQAAELERHARHVINEYTAQTFGYQKGTMGVMGTGENFVSLPHRLIKINKVNAGDTNYVGAYHIIDDGWGIRAVVDNDLTIKMAPPEEAVYVTHGVIRVPSWYSRVFHENTIYSINGEWGYASVPEPVQQAAVLLARDFATNEQEYRDRYVETVKAADWNMEFGDGAWRGTGNARADHLLARFRRSGMAVI